LDINEYVFYILRLGYIDDFEDPSSLNILSGLFYSCQQVHYLFWISWFT